MNLLHPVHTLIKDLHSEGLHCHPNTSGRRIEYQRDILRWVTEVQAEVAGQMQSILSQIEYRADGQIIAAIFGNELSETRTYDQQERLVHQELKDEAGLISNERAYEYDPAGNITARTGTPGDQHYNYDTLDRLTGQDIDAESKNWQYDYGPNHNRQTRTDGNLLEKLYNYQPDTNRLTEVDKFLGAPGQSVPQSRQFIYNQANRFAEYIEDGETVASYTYNSLGQRARKELSAQGTIFHYGAERNLLAETRLKGTDGVHFQYIWMEGESIARIDSSEDIIYLHSDHLLTPRIATSHFGAIVWRWEGESFGDVKEEGTVEMNLRFPGQYFDNESGLHYNFFRNYIPSLGRYSQSDIIGLSGGLNTYGYVAQSPLVSFDLEGLQRGLRRRHERIENIADLLDQTLCDIWPGSCLFSCVRWRCAIKKCEPDMEVIIGRGNPFMSTPSYNPNRDDDCVCKLFCARGQFNCSGIEANSR